MPLPNYQKYIVAGVPLLIVALIAIYFSDIVVYIILAWVLSMICAPLNGFLAKYIGKNFAALSSLISITILFMAIIWLFIPPIVQQTRNFANIDYQQLVASLEEPVNDWNQWLVEKRILKETVKEQVTDTIPSSQSFADRIEVIKIDSLLNRSGDTSNTGVTIIINLHDFNQDVSQIKKGSEIQSSDSFFDRVKKNLYQFFDPSRIPKIFGSIVGFFGNLLIAILSTLFISFFFLRESGLFSKIIKAIVPNKHEKQSSRAIDESATLLIRYFVGILIQVTIITIFVSAILTFLDFKNALLIGFFAAIMNVIPYVGPILGATFGVIITVSSNLEVSFYSILLPKILKLLAVFATMQLLDNFILQPNIFSKSVKAHPLEIFIVVLMGAKVGGVLGMVLAIPSYTVLRVIGKVFLSEFKLVQKITQNL